MPPATPGFGVAAKEVGRIWTEIERLGSCAPSRSIARTPRPRRATGGVYFFWSCSAVPVQIFRQCLVESLPQAIDLSVNTQRAA